MSSYSILRRSKSSVIPTEEAPRLRGCGPTRRGAVPLRRDRGSVRRGSTTILVLVVLLPLVVARGEGRERTNDITPDDYFTLAVLNESVISPDARFVVYTDQRWEPPNEKRNTDLWVVETESRSARRLTFEKSTEAAPKWSPDGLTIYFTSNVERAGESAPPYDGKTQVWRIPVAGGEPTAVSRVPEGIGTYDLLGNGQVVYYTTTHEVVDDEWKELREQYAKLEYGHGVTKFDQLWKLDLNTWRAEKLVDEKRVIRTVAASPDGRHVAMITTPERTLLSNEGWSRVDLYDAASRSVTVLTEEGWRKNHPSPYGWLDDRLSWSADGEALAFTVSFDGYPPMVYVAEHIDDRFQPREVRRPPNVTVVGGTAKWRGRTRDLCLDAEWQAYARTWCIEDVRGGREAHVRPWSHEDGVVHFSSFDGSGENLAVVMGKIDHTPDVYLVRRHDDHQRLTNANPQVDSWKLPSIQKVTWTGAKGDEVEGILELPPGYQGGDRLPMVVELHGGPTAATLCELRYWIYGRTLLAAKGFALFSPNYRGSTGYGDPFMTDLIGAENDIEVEDILTGVDAMVQRGFADPERLGVMGWSNGGYLVNCLITKTNRFKASSSGAGVLDIIIQWGTEDTPGHVVNYMEGLPWSKPEAYRRASPIDQLGRVNTPTLIHVGAGDERVPPAHARALYRALRYHAHVPTELIVYPDEGHGLTKYTHRKAKLEWDLAWFDRYLLGKSSTDEPAKPDWR